ncbi:major facilitator superfamily transporter [Ceratobasidium sp. AG-Ba]|nr:major facilitator superfamily transporter [Ceratobasidium sp. AG-Ba]
MAAATLSEADPVLRLPPVLDDLIDGSVLSSPASTATLLDESTPLLPKAQPPRPWYRRPSPKLLIPFALASALCRGMTLAPRVEVFTRIACDGLRIEPHTQMAGLAALSANSANFSIHQVETPRPHVVYAQMAIPLAGELHFGAAAHTRPDNAPRPLDADECRADPEVQRGAAKLQTLMLTLTGALSALFSGTFLGQFGDRHGRRAVIAISIFAMLATDLTFVLARSQSAHPAYAFLTAPRLLMISPLVEGCLGGFPTMQAAINAYISDSTTTGTSRAKVFSRFFGILFVGVAAGPTIGSIVPYDAFWMSIVLGLANLVLILLLLPESLTREQREAFKSRRSSIAHVDKPQFERGVVGRMRGYVRFTLRKTLGPMAILLPRKRTGQGQAVSGKDWGLTFLSISLALYLLTIAIYSVKFLYAEHVFGWGPAELSYYLSYMGTLRALNLIVILPYIIKLYKPKSSKRSPSTDGGYTPAMSPHGSIPITPSPILSSGRCASLPPDPLSPPPPAQLIKRSVRLAREQSFDLRVARISMCLEFLSYFLLCSSSSQHAFVLTTALSAFGGGTSPAMQSLALGILGPNQEADTGKLFGALSMLSSIASTVLSPMVFGSIYSLTVAAFPKAIFVVATAVLMVALLLLALVEPMRPLRRRDVEDFPPRGRSTRSKDLRRMMTG